MLIEPKKGGKKDYLPRPARTTSANIKNSFRRPRSETSEGAFPDLFSVRGVPRPFEALDQSNSSKKKKC